MIKKRRLWNKEEIVKEALKYNTRTKFCRKSGGAYNAANRLNILNEVCDHMKPIIKWNKEEITKEALKYNSRSTFREENASAHYAACKLGILDEVCKHIKKNYKRQLWNKEKIIKEALKYNSRVTFRKKSNGAANAASKLGILDEVYAHMEVVERLKWNKEEIVKAALKYNTRTKFCKKTPSAYHAARKLGILNEVCKHMIKQN